LVDLFRPSLAYAARAFGQADGRQQTEAGDVLTRIFLMLRTRTGHDFSRYKPSTIRRRIDRRMAVHQIDTLAGYARYMQQTPMELDALFRELLIGVTSFFRDPDAFQTLEQAAIPALFAGKPPNSMIRVWSTGCSTGEEAYSVAILLQEYMDSVGKNYTVQIFATDLDSRAISKARAGIYPESVAGDMLPQRLARFFTRETAGGAYRIHKSIRDMLVFSVQDVIKDPPLSKLDLILCRNLLIYLEADLQKKLMPLFHYALRPGGLLFLGTSESVGEFGELFATVDRKAKIYKRKDNALGTQRSTSGRSFQLATPLDSMPSGEMAGVAAATRLSPRKLTEQALLQVAPSSALVDEKGDILYLHGRTGMYLEPAPGETGTSNILKMAREGLRQPLSTALYTAARGAGAVHAVGLKVKTNGHFATVDLTVRPLAASSNQGQAPESALYLVLLEEGTGPDAGHDATSPVPHPGDPAPGDGSDLSHAQAQIAILKQELRAKDEHLQTIYEELESSNEELKSSNEEMQSMNEELQSTNEELETSKEELQSVNEELITVNTELQTKVADLMWANNDMNNLLAGTGIGTVFVDHQLRILRFTPAASAIINLIPGDVGRPVGHIASNLVGHGSLIADVQSVLDTLMAKEMEVQTLDGKWYTMRIQPYRTLDYIIKGVVVTFVDISEMKRTQEALRKATDMSRLAMVARDSPDAVIVQDLDAHILAWNPAAERLYGWSEAEALLLALRNRIPQSLGPKMREREHALARAEAVAPFRTRRLASNGAVLEVWVTATQLLNKAGQVYAVATTERPVAPAADSAAS
jgi:two-component system CheB/CheR fusion protein